MRLPCTVAYNPGCPHYKTLADLQGVGSFFSVIAVRYVKARTLYPVGFELRPFSIIHSPSSGPIATKLGPQYTATATSNDNIDAHNYHTCFICTITTIAPCFLRRREFCFEHRSDSVYTQKKRVQS